MTIEKKPLWVLGYGSLIFKPPPHAQFVVPGIIHGFARRFWQSSSDHRGTPHHKGRVVTLVPYKDIIDHEEIKQDIMKYENVTANFAKHDLKVWACAYYIPPEHAEEVTEYLNVREQDGYSIHEIPFQLHINPHVHNHPDFLEAIEELPKDAHTGKHVLTSVVYIGTLNNQSFIGPEALEETAAVISTSSGPSGENWEYLEKLHNSLLKLDENGKDNYLEALVKEVVRLKQKNIHMSKEHA